MRDAIPTVQRAIVHLINHQTQDLVLAENELTLGSNQKLRDYFSKQVKNALDDNQTGSAKFSSKGEQAANEECYRVLTEPNRFIASSKELARLLFTAMGTDRRINPAGLAICTYTSKDNPESLALIKIDPKEAPIERVDTRDGKSFVDFEVLSGVMPTDSEPLQKAALITPKGTQPNLDLLLLDRQSGALAANFFGVKFLNAEWALDDEKSTSNLLLAVQKAHNIMVKLAPSAPEYIGPKEADALQQSAEVMVQGTKVVFDKWIEELPLPSPAKEVVRKQIKKQFPQDTSLKINKKFAQETLLKKKRYRGDYGVVFEVDSDRFDDVVKEKKDKKLSNGTTVTRLVLEVPNFHWVR